VKIEIKHDLGRDKAVEKIDGFLDGLAGRELPAGVRIINPRRSWSGNVMTISFRAKKGLLGVEIKGRAVVEDDRVLIEVDIPAIVTTFVSEETIRTTLTQKAEALLIEGE